MRIAALYVETKGAYHGLPGVDMWDEPRDARGYRGPHPVVAHPPCARWCRLAGQVEYRGGPKRGEDGGCFLRAFEAVLTNGGVLEHPAHTAAWARFGMQRPNPHGGWTLDPNGATGPFRSWVCEVDQGHYGHRVRKPTWLYYVGTELPPALVWGKSKSMIVSERKRTGAVQRLSKKQRKATPLPFRDLLLGMARSVKKGDS